MAYDAPLAPRLPSQIGSCWAASAHRNSDVTSAAVHGKPIIVARVTLLQRCGEFSQAGHSAESDLVRAGDFFCWLQYHWILTGVEMIAAAAAVLCRSSHGGGVRGSARICRPASAASTGSRSFSPLSKPASARLWPSTSPPLRGRRCVL